MTIDDEKLRAAERAKLILTDPLIEAALANMKAEAIQRWERSALNDVEGREAAWRMVKATEAFTAELTRHIDTGNMVLKQQERRNQR